MKYLDDILQDTPTRYYPHEETAGTTWSDASGNGADGSYAGSGVTLQSFGPLVMAPLSYGALFNGSTGRALSAAITTTARPSLPFTLETWARPTSYPAPSGDWILNLYAADSSEYAAITVGTGGRINAVFGNNTPAADTVVGPVLTPGWHHIAVRFVGTDERYLYVDGVLAGTSTASIAWTGASSASYFLAAGYNGSSAFFPGAMSRTAYYQSDLPARRIASHYRAGARSPLYQTLVNTLRADADTLTITGGRVFADQLADDPQIPAIRVAVLGIDPHHRLDSGEHIDARVQVDAYADRTDEGNAWALTDRTRAVLNRQEVRVPGFKLTAPICTDRGTPIHEARFYRIRSTYKIQANV